MDAGLQIIKFSYLIVWFMRKLDMQEVGMFIAIYGNTVYFDPLDK